MCLLAPGGGKTCTCPENFVLEDNGVSCRNNCLSSMFVCRSTYKCIPFWWQCDTQVSWRCLCGTVDTKVKYSMNTQNCCTWPCFVLKVWHHKQTLSYWGFTVMCVCPSFASFIWSSEVKYKQEVLSQTMHTLSRMIVEISQMSQKTVVPTTAHPASSSVTTAPASIPPRYVTARSTVLMVLMSPTVMRCVAAVITVVSIIIITHIVSHYCSLFHSLPQKCCSPCGSIFVHLPLTSSSWQHEMGSLIIKLPHYDSLTS